MATSTERVRAFRARRAALLEAEPYADRRDPAELTRAVETTIAALPADDRDAAAVELALRYAVVIDRARDQAAALRVFGPLLQRALAALRATPASRPARRREPVARPNKVAQLRAAHSASKVKHGATR
jgi:hypothetical protein